MAPKNSERALPGDITLRIQSGFRHRRQTLMAALGHSNRERSIQREDAKQNISSHEREKSQSILDLIDLRTLSQRFLPKNVSISNYVQYLRSLLPTQFHDLIIGYYFSAQYVTSPKSLVRVPVFNDEQFSVLIQTLYLNDCIQDPSTKQVLHTELSEFLAVLFESAAGLSKLSISTFNDFQQFAIRLGAPASGSIRTFSQFVDFIGLAKNSLVHVLGPDLFTALQQACDPDLTLTAKLALWSFNLCREWNCGDLYVQLLLVRAGRNAELDLEPIRAVMNIVPESNIQAWALYAAWQSNEVKRQDGSAAPTEALALSCEMRDAVSKVDPERLVDMLLKLYNSDPSLTDWLDWDSVYQLLRYSRKQEGLKISAVHYLMGQPFVGRKFPVVVVSEGDGAFESSLRTFIGKLEGKSLDALSTNLKELSGNSRELLVQAILSPDTAQMLSIMLQYDPPWAKKLTKARALAYDVPASALRSGLASTFAKHKLIDSNFARGIIEEEKSRLRVAYLQGRRLDGLVHVDWDRLGEQLDAEFTGQISLVKRMLAEPNLGNSKSYFQKVVVSLAERIAAFILVEAPDNLKITISDSLRHGQLTNRFYSAFDSAVSQAAGGPVDATALIAQLTSQNLERNNWFVGLRHELQVMIKTFNVDCLSVWEPAGLKNAAVMCIERIIPQLLESPNGASVSTEAVSNCLPDIERLLRSFFQAARTELSTRIQTYLGYVKDLTDNPSVESVALSGPANKVLDKHRFVLALRDYLAEAAAEAIPWIALTESREEPEAFQLNDVVQLCLLNHRSSGTRQASVEVIVSERRVDQGVVVLATAPLLQGRYFDLFETVTKNLLANAFSHSGLGLHTRITIAAHSFPRTPYYQMQK